MKRNTERMLALAALAAVFLLAFWLGKKNPSKLHKPSEMGEELATQRAAWLRAGATSYHLRLIEMDEHEKLKEMIEEDMWLSVLDLHELSKNPAASEEEKSGANVVMKKVVKYFYLHPHDIIELQTSNMAEAVSDELREASATNVGGDTEKQIIDEIRTQSEPALDAFDDVITEAIRLRHERDLRTQEIINEHIKARNFPGRKVELDDVTIMMPRGISGGGGGSSDYYDFEGKSGDEEFTMVYEKNVLTVNGASYGLMDKGSVICLRILGEVFVDGKEIKPLSEQTN